MTVGSGLDDPPGQAQQEAVLRRRNQQNSEIHSRHRRPASPPRLLALRHRNRAGLRRRGRCLVDKLPVFAPRCRGSRRARGRTANPRSAEASSFSALSFAICWLQPAPMLYSKVRAKPLRVSCLAFVCPWQRCWSRQPTKPTWSSAADTRAQRIPVLIEIAWSNLHSRSS